MKDKLFSDKGATVHRRQVASRPLSARFAVKPALTMVFACCIACAGIFAASLTEHEVESPLAIDTVDVHVTEEFPEGRPVELVGEQEVSHDLKITNDGATCFIRCQTMYSSPTGSIVSTEFAVADDELWHVGEDGFLYYKTPLGVGESVELSEMISNPDEWEVTHERPDGFELAADFYVDAIQAANFTPDFGAESPWGDVVVEECVYARFAVEGVA